MQLLSPTLLIVATDSRDTFLLTNKTLKDISQNKEKPMELQLFNKPYFCISRITLDPPLIHKQTRKGLPLTIFTQGCDFNCTYCPTPHLIPECSHTIIPIERIFQILSSSKLISRLYIVGGEPTLQPCLLEFCQCAKSVSPQIEISLVTLGTRPEVITNLIQHKCIDKCILSIKAPLIAERYKIITRTEVDISKIQHTITTLEQSRIPTDYVITQTPLHTTEDIELIKVQFPKIEIVPYADLLLRNY